MIDYRFAGWCFIVAGLAVIGDKEASITSGEAFMCAIACFGLDDVIKRLLWGNNQSILLLLS